MNNLTRREKQILEMLVQGKLNKEIAVSLNISETTVKNHITNIFRKLNVKNRTQAAVVYKNGKLRGHCKLTLAKILAFILRR